MQLVRPHGSDFGQHVEQSVVLQGIELTNPLLQAQQEDAQRSGTESYFSEYSGFRSIKGK